MYVCSQICPRNTTDDMNTFLCLRPEGFPSLVVLHGQCVSSNGELGAGYRPLPPRQYPPHYLQPSNHKPMDLGCVGTARSSSSAVGLGSPALIMFPKSLLLVVHKPLILSASETSCLLFDSLTPLLVQQGILSFQTCYFIFNTYG